MRVAVSDVFADKTIRAIQRVAVPNQSKRGCRIADYLTVEGMTIYEMLIVRQGIALAVQVHRHTLNFVQEAVAPLPHVADIHQRGARHCLFGVGDVLRLAVRKVVPSHLRCHRHAAAVVAQPADFRLVGDDERICQRQLAHLLVWRKSVAAERAEVMHQSDGFGSAHTCQAAQVAEIFLDGILQHHHITAPQPQRVCHHSGECQEKVSDLVAAARGPYAQVAAAVAAHQLLHILPSLAASVACCLIVACQVTDSHYRQVLLTASARGGTV